VVLVAGLGPWPPAGVFEPRKIKTTFSDGSSSGAWTTAPRRVGYSPPQGYSNQGPLALFEGASRGYEQKSRIRATGTPRTKCRGLCGGFCKHLHLLHTCPGGRCQGVQVSAKPTNAGREAPCKGFLLTRHAAVVDRCAYRILFT